MSTIVTTTEAMEHLRMDDADKPWLDIAIPTVENAVLLWCGSDDRIRDDYTNSPLPVVKMAVLVELARLHVTREGPTQKNHVSWFMQGYVLGPGATSLLQPLRKPTVA
jgi:hypothetical protein